MKVAVAQLGARRHYAVPAALNANGLLSRFFTDIYVKSGGLGRVLRGAGPGFPLDASRRLLSRCDPGLDESRVTSYSVFGLMYKLRARCARSQSALTKTWLWGGRRFCHLVARDGLNGASVVYAYTSAAEELFLAAKSVGATCILDHATAPKTYEDDLINQEIARYPGWAAGPVEDHWAAEYTARQRREWELADTIVCGSTFAREAIRQLGGPVDKTVVLPLALRAAPITTPRHHHDMPGPLHVLFAGDDGMRKGIGDFVEAIRLAGVDRCKARVVGEVRLTDHGRRECSRFSDLLGRVPRSEMSAHYAWSDVLVLPSVSDTFGLVMLEAMAHGVPVIATTNTGAPDVLRHGVDGFIVPVMAPEAIAECLVRMASDRALLDEMSRNSVSACRRFGMQSYARKLVELVESGPPQMVSERTATA